MRLPFYPGRTFLTAILVLGAASAAAQTTVLKSLTVDVTTIGPIDSSYCAGTSAVTNYPLVQFTDPLPPSSKLRSVTYSWRTGNNSSFSWQGVPYVELYLNGTFLNSATISNYADCYPSGAKDWLFTSQDYQGPTFFPGYVYGPNGQNTITMNMSGASVNVLWGDHKLITFMYEAPPPVEFNVTDLSPEADRRIILSNSDSSYPYPHFQSLGGNDAQVPNVGPRA